MISRSDDFFSRHPMWMATLGIGLFSIMDAVMKGQALAMGAYNAMFWRMVMGALLASLLYLPSRRSWAGGKTLRIHFTRAVVTAVMAYLFFYGLTRVPLAQAIGLSFIAPIITLYLAAVVLGEQIGAHAKLAAGLGLAGVLVVVGEEIFAPNGQSDLWGMAAILLSAVFYAVNLVLQRIQSLIVQPLEIAFYQNVLVLLLLAIGVPWLVTLPETTTLWLGALVSAALAVSSVLLMSVAYRHAEAQRLVAIEYTAFIWAAILGWLMFAEVVSSRTLLGTGLIVLGCLVSERGK